MPNHRVYLLVAIIYFLLLSSCNTENKEKRAFFEMTAGRLLLSAKSTKSSSEIILLSLQDKLYDPASREKAAIWLPVGQRISLITDSSVNEIQEIYERKESYTSKVKELTTTLREYHEKI